MTAKQQSSWAGLIFMGVACATVYSAAYTCATFAEYLTAPRPASVDRPGCVDIDEFNRMARRIANHYRSDIDPGVKALMSGAAVMSEMKTRGREACPDLAALGIIR
jgi:hypothetical protein